MIPPTPSKISLSIEISSSQLTYQGALSFSNFLISLLYALLTSKFIYFCLRSLWCICIFYYILKPLGTTSYISPQDHTYVKTYVIFYLYLSYSFLLNATSFYLFPDLFFFTNLLFFRGLHCFCTSPVCSILQYSSDLY